ncbi:hypothetical protein [Clostridium tertium]|uniref:hypothetical protein n=1 Tax=Clostridium tertium TaxID=1559 RepID=UPI00241EB692|nr:hypothetical protein [Clostridium tertium]
MHIILRSLLFYSLIQFLITAIPIKYNFYPYKNLTSDGYKIVETILGRVESKSVDNMEDKSR